MATAFHHALSSAQRWGGTVDDYIAIHRFFDESKDHVGDFRHRALRHHAQGVAEAEKAFGHSIVTSEGRRVPVRWIAEQHILEDLGFIPTLADWLRQIRAEPWMNKPMKLSRVLEQMDSSLSTPSPCSAEAPLL